MVAECLEASPWWQVVEVQGMNHASEVQSHQGLQLEESQHEGASAVGQKQHGDLIEPLQCWYRPVETVAKAVCSSAI